MERRENTRTSTLESEGPAPRHSPPCKKGAPICMLSDLCCGTVLWTTLHHDLFDSWARIPLLEPLGSLQQSSCNSYEGKRMREESGEVEESGKPFCRCPGCANREAPSLMCECVGSNSLASILRAMHACGHGLKWQGMLPGRQLSALHGTWVSCDQGPEPPSCSTTASTRSPSCMSSCCGVWSRVMRLPSNMKRIVSAETAFLEQ